MEGLLPMPAIGWNVWAGLPDGILYLQNPTPIPISTLSYIVPAILLSGVPGHFGQVPERRLTMQRVLNRG
jgi:hypothetical protein